MYPVARARASCVCSHATHTMPLFASHVTHTSARSQMRSPLRGVDCAARLQIDRIRRIPVARSQGLLPACCFFIHTHKPNAAAAVHAGRGERGVQCHWGELCQSVALLALALLAVVESPVASGQAVASGAGLTTVGGGGGSILPQSGIRIPHPFSLRHPGLELG
jgi:hypothetical protein